MPLLYFLRNDLKLRGPSFGCGLGVEEASMEVQVYTTLDQHRPCEG